jgi:hypothetical protein
MRAGVRAPVALRALPLEDLPYGSRLGDRLAGSHHLRVVLRLIQKPTESEIPDRGVGFFEKPGGGIAFKRGFPIGHLYPPLYPLLVRSVPNVSIGHAHPHAV